MAGIELLATWLNPLIQKLSEGQRRQLMRNIATLLRNSQRQRIQGQVTPDGASFVPRKLQKTRNPKTGPMFVKLRAKWLKTDSGSNYAATGFNGSASRLARVHQFGLVDKVNREGLTVRYPERQLLGINSTDIKQIETLIFNYLNQGS